MDIVHQNIIPRIPITIYLSMSNSREIWDRFCRFFTAIIVMHGSVFTKVEYTSNTNLPQKSVFGRLENSIVLKAKFVRTWFEDACLCYL